eukprot:5746883-Pyramimonas_sp.AAC.1
MPFLPACVPVCFSHVCLVVRAITATVLAQVILFAREKRTVQSFAIVCPTPACQHGALYSTDSDLAARSGASLSPGSSHRSSCPRPSPSARNAP